MQYTRLARLIHGMEAHWRAKGVSLNIHRFPSHLRIRPGHNVQYFAVSDHTATTSEDLPVIVLVGVNYTQGAQKIPDEIGKVQHHVISTTPFVEDKVNQTELRYIEEYNKQPELWKNSALCSQSLSHPILRDHDGKIQKYHLVMTNLSPWITTDAWSTIADVDGRNITADLLSAPPFHADPNVAHPFDHIRALRTALAEEVEGQPIIWIGHGVHSVWEHFRTLMVQMRVDNWMLTANLGYPKAASFFDRPRRFAAEHRVATEVNKPSILDCEE